MAVILWHQECLWNVYRYEINDPAIENNNEGNTINNSKSTTSKSFEGKTK